MDNPVHSLLLLESSVFTIRGTSYIFCRNYTDKDRYGLLLIARVRMFF